MGDRELPMPNRAVAARWNRYTAAVHAAQLADVRTSIPTEPPPTFSFLSQRSKRNQVYTERAARIERENLILLDKMRTIMAEKQMAAATAEPFLKESLNRGARKAAMLRIMAENEALLRRIQARRPVYEVSEFEKQHVRKEYLLSRVGKFPYMSDTAPQATPPPLQNSQIRYYGHAGKGVVPGSTTRRMVATTASATAGATTLPKIAGAAPPPGQQSQTARKSHSSSYALHSPASSRSHAASAASASARPAPPASAPSASSGRSGIGSSSGKGGALRGSKALVYSGDTEIDGVPCHLSVFEKAESSSSAPGLEFVAVDPPTHSSSGVPVSYAFHALAAAFAAKPKSGSRRAKDAEEHKDAEEDDDDAAAGPIPLSLFNKPESTRDLIVTHLLPRLCWAPASAADGGDDKRQLAMRGIEADVQHAPSKGKRGAGADRGPMLYARVHLEARGLPLPSTTGGDSGADPVGVLYSMDADTKQYVQIAHTPLVRSGSVHRGSVVIPYQARVDAPLRLGVFEVDAASGEVLPAACIGEMKWMVQPMLAAEEIVIRLIKNGKDVRPAAKGAQHPSLRITHEPAAPPGTEEKQTDSVEEEEAAETEADSEDKKEEPGFIASVVAAAKEVLDSSSDDEEEDETPVKKAKALFQGGRVVSGAEMLVQIVDSDDVPEGGAQRPKGVQQLAEPDAILFQHYYRPTSLTMHHAVSKAQVDSLLARLDHPCAPDASMAEKAQALLGLFSATRESEDDAVQLLFDGKPLVEWKDLQPYQAPSPSLDAEAASSAPVEAETKVEAEAETVAPASSSKPVTRTSSSVSSPVVSPRVSSRAVSASKNAKKRDSKRSTGEVQAEESVAAAPAPVETAASKPTSPVASKRSSSKRASSKRASSNKAAAAPEQDAALAAAPVLAPTEPEAEAEATPAAVSKPASASASRRSSSKAQSKSQRSSQRKSATTEVNADVEAAAAAPSSNVDEASIKPAAVEPEAAPEVPASGPPAEEAEFAIESLDSDEPAPPAAVEAAAAEKDDDKEAEAQSEPEMKVESEGEAVAETESKAEAEAEAEAEPKAAFATQPEAAESVETEVAPDIEIEADAKEEVVPEIEAEPEVEAAVPDEPAVAAAAAAAKEPSTKAASRPASAGAYELDDDFGDLDELDDKPEPDTTQPAKDAKDEKKDEDVQADLVKQEESAADAVPAEEKSDAPAADASSAEADAEPEPAPVESSEPASEPEPEPSKPTPEQAEGPGAQAAGEPEPEAEPELELEGVPDDLDADLDVDAEAGDKDAEAEKQKEKEAAEAAAAAAAAKQQQADEEEQAAKDKTAKEAEEEAAAKAEAAAAAAAAAKAAEEEEEAKKKAETDAAAAAEAEAKEKAEAEAAAAAAAEAEAKEKADAEAEKAAAEAEAEAAAKLKAEAEAAAKAQAEEEQAAAAAKVEADKAEAAKAAADEPVEGGEGEAAAPDAKPKEDADGEAGSESKAQEDAEGAAAAEATEKAADEEKAADKNAADRDAEKEAPLEKETAAEAAPEEADADAGPGAADASVESDPAAFAAEAEPVAAAPVASPITLTMSVRCSSLPAHPAHATLSGMVAMYAESPSSGEYQFCSQSETCAGSSPSFSTPLSFESDTGAAAAATAVMFSVYHVVEGAPLAEDGVVAQALTTQANLVAAVRDGTELVLPVQAQGQIVPDCTITLFNIAQTEGHASKAAAVVAAAGAADDTPKVAYDVVVSCRDLKRPGHDSLCPMVALYCADATGEFGYIGQTERIENETSPVFSTRIRVESSPAVDQPLMFSIYHVGEGAEISPDDSVGAATTTMHALIAATEDAPIRITVVQDENTLEGTELTAFVHKV